MAFFGLLKVTPPGDRGTHKNLRGAIFTVEFGPFLLFAIYESEISSDHLLSNMSENSKIGQNTIGK